MEEVIIEGFWTCDGVGHHVHVPITVFVDAPTGSTEIVERIGHVLVHVEQTLEIIGVGLIVLNDQFSLDIRQRIGSFAIFLLDIR